MSEQTNPGNPAPSPMDRTRNRQKLVILFGIAIVPMIVAYIMFFYFPALIPAHTTNEGTLIQPILPISEVQPTGDAPPGNWTLLIPVPQDCASQCEQRLYLTRQIKIGLGKDADRIARMALLSAPASERLSELLAKEHADLTTRTYDPAALNRDLQQRLPALETVTEGVLLMDPNGNIMMFYPFDKLGSPMRKDLKHLLKISNIG